MGGTRRTPVACGVDIGSTNTKVVAIDDAGNVVARASRPTPREPESLWIDADALFRVIEELVLEACGDSFEIHAISAAGVGEDGLLVDSGLRPLTKALAWFDPRRQHIFRMLRPQLHDDDTFDAECDPSRALVGWAWARARAEQLSTPASSWVAIADLAGVRWSGRPFFSDTLASRTGAWRSHERSWDDDRVTLTLGSKELLPPVVPTGEVVGGLASPLLRSVGVVAGDAITVAGGHDHPIGGWGIGELVPGAVLDSMGTAEVIVAQSPLATVRRRDSLAVAPGIRSHGTTLLRVEELARNAEWASQDPEVGAHIRALLSGTSTPEPVLGEGYFLAGTRGGGRPSYAMDAPRDAKARASAVLGALAHVGREAVRDVQASAVDGSVVRLAGGWTRSPGWIEIKAAVNGYHAPVILEPEVTAVGAALLAAKARGWNPDPARAFSGRGAVQLAETLTSSGTTSVSTQVS